VVLATVGSACASGGNGVPRFTASAWPEADAIFRREPRWLGADAAFSIQLTPTSTLWLFGDTFVATPGSQGRRGAKLVRNSVAVQSGLDPTTATIQFAWRQAGGQPSSFFPEDGERWFWPGHGIRVDGVLVVFLSRVHNTPGQGLGFVADGWRAAIIDEPEAPPSAWAPRFVDPGVAPAGFVVGQGLVRDGGRIVALAIREPGDHAATLVRWNADALAAGRIDEGQWWSGRGWVAAQELAGAAPAIVMADAGSECSVSWSERLGKFVHVKSLGFGATSIAVSLADHLVGPWSTPAPVFRPPESERADAFVYAGKGHAELLGADLVLTYAANTLAGLGALLDDDSIYYPRFVRLSFDPR
jgi:hypothetical protein